MHNQSAHVHSTQPTKPVILNINTSSQVICPDCGSVNAARLGAIPDAFEFAGTALKTCLPGGNLYRCPTCNLHWRHPQLNKNELDALYRQGSTESWQDNPAKRLDWQLATALIRQNKNTSSVLDVGCFDGRFLEYLGKPYFRAGIEVHPLAARHAAAKGIQIMGHNFSDLESLTLSFDTVVAMDVIEHVKSPLAFLASMVKATRPGGLIIVSTGNTAALPWRLMGGMYWYCSIAEHLSFINPEWCQRAADTLGLHIDKIEMFSHEPTKTLDSALQAGANIFYRCMPGFAYKLRCCNAQIKGQPLRPSYKTPPHWRSAKDHLLVAFRVPILGGHS